MTHDPLEHAKFRVFYAEGNSSDGAYRDLGYFWTDSEGKIELSRVEHGIADGWFKVVEEEAPTGFAIREGEDTQQAFVQSGKSYTFRFENVPLSALVVWKYDSVIGEAVQGAVFQVKYLGGTSGTGGTIIGTYKTSANGSFTVTGLREGTYICEELSSDSGHVIDTAPQTAYISGKQQDVVQLYFGNSPKGSLLVKKINSVTHEPISDVEFFVTTADGTVVGDANGKFVTDSAGSFTVSNITPGTTLVVKETRAKAGYLMDDAPQTATIKAGQTVMLEFRNQPQGSLVINKLDSVTHAPLEGVRFKIVFADGSYVDDGALSSKGVYNTDKNGQIILNLTGTVIVTEEASIEGYTIDPNTRTQTVEVRANDTQTLTFFNDPVGGLELIKVNAADKTQRIPNTTFEIRRVSDGGLVDTVTTGTDGRVYVPLESGSYYALETEAGKGFQLDNTPIYFTVEDGKTTTKTVTNKAISGILIHKIDSTTGEGIYGVSFILYDSGNNPIAQETSDDRGYVRFENLTAGRYYLRELENEGYVADTELKTVYVRNGEVTELTWKNTPICGQIQIIKKSADDNSINGLPAGTLLEGAVFEIYDKAGNVVDTIKSDRNGRAVSKTLPLSRYTIREVRSPANYAVNPTVMTAYLEHEGQIVTFEVQDSSISTGVSIKKTGPVQAVPGQPIRYVFSEIKNSSTVALDSFYWRDQLPAQVTLNKIVTGSYNQPLSYKVVYKTNLSGDYRTLADNLSSSKTYVLDARPAVLGLAANERVIEVMFVFGNVKAGFAQVETPYIYATAHSGLANNSSIVNVADVGGLYNGQWIQAVSRWLTTVYTKTTVKLPKTGY